MEMIRLYELKTKFEMVREIESVKAGKAQDVFEKVLKDLFNPFQESFFVIFFNAKNQVLGFQELFKGGLTGSTVDAPTLLKSVLLANAVSFIIAHNHPSGEVTPSPSDRQVTERIKTASDTIGLNLFDHLVFSDKDYFSFAENSIL
ncbi:MAG: JAB domain-containing protein [Desulfobacteraceae bacterium]|nr:JAB domain-containing protein [Desulfobacteraceae bacterium]